MRVLVGCERFGHVRDAFMRRGHEAYSCDLVESVNGGPHIVDDVLEVVHYFKPDLFIVHPECSYVSASGNHWCYPNGRKAKPGTVVGDERIGKKIEAINFAWKLLKCGVPKICLENPVGILSSAIRRPDQVIQPWQFGVDASKATCLWLSGLPKLEATNVLPGGRATRRANQTPSGQNKLGPSADRALIRAETYPPIADAMAAQWG